MINHSLFQISDREISSSDNDLTWLEYNLGGWNGSEQAQTSQQRLCLKVVERLRSGVCRSVNRLYIENASQVNIGANQVENESAYSANQQFLKLFRGTH